MNKAQAYQVVLRAIQTKCEELNEAWELIQSTNQEEGKSSAGDKHETGAALVHLEMEKIAAQVQAAQHQRSEVEYNKPDRVPMGETVQNGSLVQTTIGWYYVITSLGKLNVGNQDIWVISQASPVAQAMIGKHPNETFTWGKVSGIIVQIHH